MLVVLLILSLLLGGSFDMNRVKGTYVRDISGDANHRFYKLENKVNELVKALEQVAVSQPSTPALQQAANQILSTTFTPTGEMVLGLSLIKDESGGPINVEKDARISEMAAKNVVPGKYYSNLRCDPDVTHPDHKLRIRADWLTVQNSAGETITLTSVDVICDIALAGPIENGRDQSANFSIANWLYFDVIYDALRDQVRSIASLSSSSPTFPTGYTHYFRGTARRTIDTNHIRFQATQDDKTWGGYDEAWNMVLSGSDPVQVNTYEILTVAGAVPPTAKRIFGLMGSSGSTKVGMAVSSDWGGSGLITLSGCEFRATVQGPSGSPVANYYIGDPFYFDLPLLIPQTLYWAGSSTTATKAIMIIYGWIDDI